MIGLAQSPTIQTHRLGETVLAMPSSRADPSQARAENSIPQAVQTQTFLASK